MKSWLARWLMQPWRGRALALGIAALLAIGWVGLLPGSLQLLDERSTDMLWRMTASKVPERRVVLVYRPGPMRNAAAKDFIDFLREHLTQPKKLKVRRFARKSVAGPKG